MDTLSFLTPQEVAHLLNLRLETVYRSLRSGRLHHFRFGRQYRITKQQLLEYMTVQAGPATAGGEPEEAAADRPTGVGVAVGQSPSGTTIAD